MVTETKLPSGRADNDDYNRNYCCQIVRTKAVACVGLGRGMWDDGTYMHYRLRSAMR